MSVELTVDLIEQKKDLWFVTGIALTDLALNDQFTHLCQYGQKSSSKRKLTTVNLTIEALIVAGEPVDTVSAQTAVLVALNGDGEPLAQQAIDLSWRKKGGRLIRTSDPALTLTDE